MDLIDQLKAIADRAAHHPERLATEEATKNALVMPFINALGYNVFDPAEVVPEFTADVGIKRGEKVDYVIMRDGRPIILMECKTVGTDLDESVMSQLFRYFTVTDARIGVCTNGIMYRFYSDLEKPNRMDDKPFLEFDIRHLQPELVERIKELSKSHFDEDAILESASELKYTGEIRKALAKQLREPDEDFVRLLAARVFSGRFTQAIRTQFETIVRNAFREFVRDQIHERLQSALEEDERPQEAFAAPSEMAQEGEPDEEEVDPTEEELEGFYIVKSILRESVSSERIVYRDVRSYFGILLDNNNRKPLARLHFNSAQKYLGLFDNPDKQEDRIPIGSLDEIFEFRERILATPSFYEEAEGENGGEQAKAVGFDGTQVVE